MHQIFSCFSETRFFITFFCPSDILLPHPIQTLPLAPKSYSLYTDPRRCSAVVLWILYNNSVFDMMKKRR